MSMMKKIEIDGKAVAFKASAAIPRIYRIKFQEGYLQGFICAGKEYGDGDPEKSSLDLFSLEMFENIAYVMAKHADCLSRIIRRTGWMSLIHSVFIRFCRTDRSVGNEHQDGCRG